jgi:hypothetical protein
MYLGLTKAPTYYMDMMNNVFMEYMGKFVMVFINDILVCTMDEGGLEEQLRLVLQELQNQRLYTKLSKCEFWKKEVFS